MASPFRTSALAALALLAACGPRPPAGPAKRVILITCDTLRADHLGCYGYGRPTSPNLDALAAEATVFDDAWSSAPLTGPSLSALLTGRIPDEVGVTNNRELMPSEVVTLAEVARDAGVATAAFVSNGVLRRPAASQGDLGVAQGFQQFDDRMTGKELNRGLMERAADATTDAVLSWLATRAADEPFLLWVHYQDPHGPYTPPPEHLAPFRRDHAGEPELPAGSTNSGQGQIPRYQQFGTERRAGQYTDRYDGEIRFFDAQLGRLIAGLQARGLYEDALIVFTADHGESLGEHGYWFCHGEHAHSELVRVPLLVRWPAALRQPGARTPLRGATHVAELVQHLDLAPTVLEALGLPRGAGRGASLLGESLPPGRVAPQFRGPLRTGGRTLAVTDGRWRVLLVGQEPPKLYDLAADPGEVRDVAAQNPAALQDLHARYTAFMAADARPWAQPAQREMDDAARRALEGLGYTDGEGDGH
jgi:arylsulfatase